MVLSIAVPKRVYDAQSESTRYLAVEVDGPLGSASGVQAVVKGIGPMIGVSCG